VQKGSPALALQAAADARSVPHKVDDPVFGMGWSRLGLEEVELDDVKGPENLIVRGGDIPQ
jgi:hypothetical protein